MDKTRTNPTIFRRHNDGTVTDVFEDDCVWVRDETYVFARDLRDTDIILEPLQDPPDRTFEGIRRFFQDHEEVEGILFAHADGREAQIQRKDFGL